MRAGRSPLPCPDIAARGKRKVAGNPVTKAVRAGSVQMVEAACDGASKMTGAARLTERDRQGLKSLPRESMTFVAGIVAVADGLTGSVLAGAVRKLPEAGIKRAPSRTLAIVFGLAPRARLV